MTAPVLADRVMKARRQSTCPLCRGPVKIGQQIARMGPGCWTHATCLISLGPPQPRRPRTRRGSTERNDMTMTQADSDGFTQRRKDRAHIHEALSELETAITSVLRGFTRAEDHELVRALTDRELLTLAAWDETDEIISAEYNRRAAEHRQQAQRFAGLRGDVELVAVLAERIKPKE